MKRLLGVLLVLICWPAWAVDPVTTPNYSQSFSAVSSVDLLHSLGTKNVIVVCYDANDVQITPTSVDIGATVPYNVAVTFSGSTTGRCVVNAGAGGKYYTTFSSQTTIVIDNADLVIDPYRAHVVCYDSGSPRRRVEPDSTEFDEGTGDLTIYFYVAQSGRCTVY